MKRKNRRDFLKLCAASVPALALGSDLFADKTKSAVSTEPGYRTPASLERYIDPLSIPSRLAAYESRRGASRYRVRMLEFRQKMHSQLPPTRLWGYEGQYPGPTFDVVRGNPVEVSWENHLPLQHIFAIDPRIHGAMPPSPAVRTVPHLHGSRTRSKDDGLPELWFPSGHAALYQYPNDQPAATLWYHDHAVGITRLNVYAGLSGFYFLRDQPEQEMNLPSGVYEIPLLLQDRSLDDQGQLIYNPTHDDGKKLPSGVWGPEFFGDLPVVNGAIYPYLDVEPRCYRLRLLNGSNSRFLNLFLNLAKSVTDIPALVSFHQIGTDGGFLPKSVAMDNILLGPAERADLIVDFSGLQGKTVTLCNNAAAPFPGWQMSEMSPAPLNEFMQFRVHLPLSGEKACVLPQSTAFRALDPAKSTATRDFLLTEQFDAEGKSLGVRINGKGYDDPVTESVKLGSTEQWRFINMTEDAHPMHLHLVQFQILQRQAFEDAAMRSGTLRLVGLPRPPRPYEAGYKDTAVVNPGEVLTIIVNFEGYTGRYVFHCHMLEHEDNDMMRPFEVV